MAIPSARKLRYLGSIVTRRGDINEDINHCIRVGWQKWRGASGILCNKKISMGLREKAYHVIVRPALLYGSECWPIKKTQVQRLTVAEMRIIRWMCGYTRLDRLRNEIIREK